MKNTMIGVLADWLCPLSCMSCGITGELLCECCRKNMIPRLELCLKCGAKLQGNVCKNCRRQSYTYYGYPIFQNIFYHHIGDVKIFRFVVVIFHK
mgnify:CR=1 FL=1